MYSSTKDDTVHSLKSSTSNLKESANAALDDARDDLKIVANKAGRKVRQLFDSASSELSHATDTVTTQIRSKPVQSSLIALAAGFVLGALLRR